MKLTITEIFPSIQGESRNTGFPALFIRLSECNLRCHYCDTSYAYQKGEEYTIDEIIAKVLTYKNIHHIALTGGEPLLQKNIHSLIDKLLALRYQVQIETNGSISVKYLPKRTIKIVDVKTPSSHEEDSFHMENLQYLSSDDELKFVISDEKDFSFAKKFLEDHLQNCRATVSFSPGFGTFSAAQLSALIMQHQLKVRLNMQLHKIIWPNGEPGANES